jgi:signal transduction histidine kinase
MVVPFLPFVVAIIAYAPLSGPGVTTLTGPWAVLVGGVGAPGVLTVDEVARAQEVRSLPGPLPPATNSLRLARTFSIDAAFADTAHILVFGGVSNGVASVFVNGAWVGSEGVPADAYKLGHVALQAYPVPADRLRPGDNVVVVTIDREGLWVEQPRVSIVDQRLAVGPVGVVRPWFDRVSILEHLLEFGGIVILAFVCALLVGLSFAERDANARAVQRACALLSVAIAAYLAGKSGLSIVLGSQREIVPLAVTCIALSVPELLDRALLGSTGRFHLLNRVVCGVHIVIQFLVSAAIVYIAFIPWLFVIMLRGVVVVIISLRQSLTTDRLLLGASVAAMVVAGVNDLLTDLTLVSSPRLFTLAAVDMGVIGSIFVVSRFLHTMSDNATLLQDVEEKNAALTHALDRAEESTRLKSAFLANTSHELRTPLNSIINVPEGLLEEFAQKPFIVCGACASLFEAPEGYAVKAGDACPECGATDVLKTELRAVFVGDPDAAMRYLKAIQHSGRHLLAVVNDILDFSKLEAGRMTLHLEEVALSEILEKLVMAMGPLADARRITLQVTPVPSTVQMRTDSVKLSQVLMNLVSNAIKFSPEDSVVEVRADVVDDTVTLAVVDHGIGIAEADRAKVFESFLQLDNSHTRKVGGTGLGLAITRKIVELMQGHLRVEATPGQGSTFVVVVPCRQQAATSESA